MPAAATAITLWGFTSFCIAGPQPRNDLERAFYDYGVIGYCGLSTDAAAAGFQRELKRIVARDTISEQKFNAARSAAMTMVELEWDNRGLGGFRRWCRTDGAGALERFMAVPSD